jgi:transposase
MLLFPSDRPWQPGNCYAFSPQNCYFFRAKRSLKMGEKVSKAYITDIENLF